MVIKSKEESLLNIGDIEKFINKTGIALTAYSIFLYILLEIFSASYVNESSDAYTIFLALLFGIVVILGYFILEVSQNYKSKIVSFLGLVICGLPWLLYVVLQENIKLEIYSGGYILILILSVLGGIWLINFIFTKIKDKYKENMLFILLSVLIPILFFLITKVTVCMQAIYTYSREHTSGILQSALLGLELGINFGIIIIPAFFAINKIIESKNLRNKK